MNEFFAQKVTSMLQDQHLVVHQNAAKFFAYFILGNLQTHSTTTRCQFPDVFFRISATSRDSAVPVVHLCILSDLADQATQQTVELIELNLVSSSDSNQIRSILHEIASRFCDPSVRTAVRFTSIRLHYETNVYKLTSVDGAELADLALTKQLQEEMKHLQNRKPQTTTAENRFLNIEELPTFQMDLETFTLEMMQNLTEKHVNLIKRSLEKLMAVFEVNFFDPMLFSAYFCGLVSNTDDENRIQVRLRQLFYPDGTVVLLDHPNFPYNLAILFTNQQYHSGMSENYVKVMLGHMFHKNTRAYMLYIGKLNSEPPTITAKWMNIQPDSLFSLLVSELENRFDETVDRLQNLFAKMINDRLESVGFSLSQNQRPETVASFLTGHATSSFNHLNRSIGGLEMIDNQNYNAGTNWCDILQVGFRIQLAQQPAQPVGMVKYKSNCDLTKDPENESLLIDIKIGKEDLSVRIDTEAVFDNATETVNHFMPRQKPIRNYRDTLENFQLRVSMSNLELKPNLLGLIAGLLSLQYHVKVFDDFSTLLLTNASNDKSVLVILNHMNHFTTRECVYWLVNLEIRAWFYTQMYERLENGAADTEKIVMVFFVGEQLLINSVRWLEIDMNRFEKDHLHSVCTENPDKPTSATLFWSSPGEKKVKLEENLADEIVAHLKVERKLENVEKYIDEGVVPLDVPDQIVDLINIAETASATSKLSNYLFSDTLAANRVNFRSKNELIFRLIRGQLKPIDLSYEDFGLVTVVPSSILPKLCTLTDVGEPEWRWVLYKIMHRFLETTMKPTTSQHHMLHFQKCHMHNVSELLHEQNFHKLSVHTKSRAIFQVISIDNLQNDNNIVTVRNTETDSHISFENILQMTKPEMCLCNQDGMIETKYEGYFETLPYQAYFMPEKFCAIRS